MRTRTKFSMLTASALLISACGGGSSSTPAPTPGQEAQQPSEELLTTATGKVIDGYISGATVWMDLNANGVLDEGEPRAISGNSGDYSLELTSEQQQCLPYASLYVDVPVGAMDEEQGLVDQAYQMAMPPRLQSMQSDLNVSP